MPAKIGPYEIERSLGEGGMGVVYAALDPRLGRRVAIKTIRGSGDMVARERLWREARAVASLSHPNVCQIYDVGEHDGDLYIAMELLEGEPLTARIERGAMPLEECLRIGLGVLSALEALHERSLLHRDLKPANVFLTPHGVKLLDFGLAHSSLMDGNGTDVRLTMPGRAVGTPGYMAPERWAGETLEPASDLFAVGALLFEMVTGRPVFAGRTLIEIYRAILEEQPPALTGGAAAMAVDRILQRALAKRPADRYRTAASMAEEVRSVLAGLSSGNPASIMAVRAPRRLMVLPLRILRPDPETDFLSFSLPDAITTSLSGRESLIVRSSATAQRYSSESPDLERIAKGASIDAFVYGTLLRAGDQVRVSMQLVEAPSGTVLCSRAAQVKLQDIFELQDELAREIVSALSGSLALEDCEPHRTDVPASPRAYELYLRANQLGYNNRVLTDARDLYRTCLEEDPKYAPAWARLGRVYRVMAKYGQGGDAGENLRLAEAAFLRALEINPDLALAHNLYTYFEIEELGRSIPSMVRLLDRARRRTADPELFAGLVLACRFGGLLKASIAADERARRLDPGTRTGVQYTYWMLGDWEKAMLYDEEHQRWILHYTLSMVGRESEAIEGYRAQEASRLPGLGHTFVVSSRAALERRRDECLDASNTILESSYHDPEGLMYVARNLAHVGESDRALDTLDRVVAGGFYCVSLLERDPWLAPLRGDARFGEIQKRSEAGRREAEAAFLAAGGQQLLGMQATPDPPARRS